MTCRGFQYEEGKEYEEETADACHSGFHACEHPLDCLNWKYIGSKEDDRYDKSEQKAWEFVGAKMFRVDGEKVKPDTWYRLENGELVEVD